MAKRIKPKEKAEIQIQKPSKREVTVIDVVSILAETFWELVYGSLFGHKKPEEEQKPKPKQ